jgi:hypothetical protein
MADGLSAHDGRKRRCPMLGHDVSFAYCRAPASDAPCHKVLDCWWEEFDVETFIRTCYGHGAIARLREPRQDKACTLVDLIEKARRASRE